MDLKWEKEKIYALGSWFYKDYKRGNTHTFEDKLALLINTINTWSLRNLTWLGKITVIKTLCISKINYAISTFETPEWFLNKNEKSFRRFFME